MSLRAQREKLIQHLILRALGRDFIDERQQIALFLFQVMFEHLGEHVAVRAPGEGITGALDALHQIFGQAVLDKTLGHLDVHLVARQTVGGFINRGLLGDGVRVQKVRELRVGFPSLGHGTIGVFEDLDEIA